MYNPAPVAQPLRPLRLPSPPESEESARVRRPWLRASGQVGLRERRGEEGREGEGEGEGRGGGRAVLVLLHPSFISVFPREDLQALERVPRCPSQAPGASS